MEEEKETSKNELPLPKCLIVLGMAGSGKTKFTTVRSAITCILNKNTN